VAGRIQRHRPLRVAEELARRLEPERDELVEDERLAEPTLVDVLADGLIGSEARHERHRHRRVERLLERSGLGKLRLEEAHAVHRPEHGLYDAAEARRHAAREDDLGDLAAAQGVDAGGSRGLVAGLARPGQRGEVLVRRRLEHASDQVRLGRELARRDHRAQPLEELLVEPELVEDTSDLRADALDHEAAPTEVGRDET
jgi:hypothetical protein